eukprot:gene9840-7043_t
MGDGYGYGYGHGLWLRLWAMRTIRRLGALDSGCIGNTPRPPASRTTAVPADPPSSSRLAATDGSASSGIASRCASI